MRRYYLAIITVVIVAILAVLLIIGLRPSAKKTTTNTGKSTTTKSKVATANDLSNTDSEFRLTIRGHIVGEQEYRAIRITVSRTTRSIQILNGYEESVERTQTYANTQAAFTTFAKAIDLSGFTRTRTAKQADETGVCATGYRYIYEIVNGSKQELRSWATSCAAADGTFAGTSNVRLLFQNQFGDYDKQVAPVRL